jgi:hypothetical protein
MPKSNISPAVKRQVFERAKGRCEYCQSPAAFSTHPFAMEHIVPKSKNGSNAPENLALACLGCNGSKYAKTRAIDPVTLQSVSLFHPRTQIWSEHFTWNETFTRIIGLSPTGRATAEALKLNRPELLNLRFALMFIGEHPPE